MIGVIAPAIGHLARFGITSTSLKAGAGQFAQALPFGAGYSFGTYVGFPKNYQNSGKQNYASYSMQSGNTMNYNNRRTKKWFSFRKTRWYWKPTYHRKMRRTVYVHPRGSYR